MPTFRNIHLVINPASGPSQPETYVFAETLGEAGVAFTIHEVSEAEGHDPVALAQAAVAEGADVVVACGGDGTVRACAIALEGTGVPLGILPEGSANVLSKDLGIPSDSHQALALILGGDNRVQPLDLGCLQTPGQPDGRFILRVGTGWQAAWTQTVPEEEKDAMGRWAYLRHAFRLREGLSTETYRLKLDGEAVETDGVTLLVCNSTNVGLPGLSFAPGATTRDGLLHVVVLKEADWGAILKLMARTLASPLASDTPPEPPAPDAPLALWSVRSVEVDCDAQDAVTACDGEHLPAPFPFRASVLPRALSVVVPA
jgi:diacylglycerol kinase family enzyme